jgi:hypothetical protein
MWQLRSVLKLRNVTAAQSAKSAQQVAAAEQLAHSAQHVATAVYRSCEIWTKTKHMTVDNSRVAAGNIRRILQFSA